MGAPIVRELLRKENYEKWTVWMKTYLLSKGLWRIVVGTEPKPEVPEQEHDWELKNGKALHAILVSCEDEILPIISEVDSAKGAWDEIWAFMVPHHSSVVHLQGPSTFAGTSNDSNTWRGKLYKAVVKDDWVAAKLIIDDQLETLSSIVLIDETILHIAVLHDHVDFVKKLLKLEISQKDMEITLPNRGNFTALHLAVVRGNLEMVKVLVLNNPNLLRLKDKYDRLPLTIASFMGNEAMVNHLRSVDDTRRRNIADVKYLIDVIVEEDYDSALDFYERNRQLTFAENENGLTPLQALAGKPFAYPSGNQLKFWQKLIYKCIHVHQFDAGNIEGSVLSKGNNDGSLSSKAANWLRERCWDAANFITRGLFWQIYYMKLSNVRAVELLETMSDHIISLNDLEIDEDIMRNAMETAYRFGNVEFIVMVAMYNPTLLERNIISVRSMLSIAIAYRQERIWSDFFYGFIGRTAYTFDIFEELWEGKSLLHEVAKLPPSNRLSKVSGPAMQMQRELQWFKEVEIQVPPPLLKGRKYWEDMTAKELFTEEHKDLVKEAEKWMRETSTSCMVVTTLIATVMFAAAFTVPGGNDSQKGIPICLPQSSFLVFIIADALSLFSSTASILMFLSILTSRFSQEDFLESLPKKLVIGLATLFSSIATMMVAFSATLVIVLHDRYKWVAIPISLFASVPVTLFAFLQLPLLLDMILSTYGPSIFREQTKSVFDSVPTRPILQTETVQADPV